MRAYEVVGEYSEMGTEDRILAEMGGFNLSLDVHSLDPESAVRARASLRDALAALENDADLTETG